jgi:prepilin-type N-terminal cleavage/methylation domain-containing protein
MSDISNVPLAARCRGLKEKRGFTLLEMLVALIIGTVIVGGVMGLISVSLQHKARLKEKRILQPVLETAAETILADPGRINEGSISFPNMTGSPVVGITATPVEISSYTTTPGVKTGQLYRVMLNYKSGYLEFSVLVPPDARK